jgi:hypothetical protein
MARRPELLKNDAMTREQLKQFERELTFLSPFIVREKYKTIVDKCRFLELPTPRLVQELVATWRVLWKWRK